MNLIVRGRTPKYVHARIRRLDQVDALFDLIRPTYEARSVLV